MVFLFLLLQEKPLLDQLVHFPFMEKGKKSLYSIFTLKTFFFVFYFFIVQV